MNDEKMLEYLEGIYGLFKANKSENDVLKQEIENLKSISEISENNISKLKKQNNDLILDTEQLKSNESKLRTKLEILEKNFSDSSEKNKILEQKIVFIESSEKDLKLEVEKLLEKNKELRKLNTESGIEFRKNIATIDAEVRKILQEYAKSSISSAAAESSIILLKTKISDLEKELESIRKTIILDANKANKTGAPAKLTNEDVIAIIALRENGVSLRKIGDLYNVNHQTIDNAVKKHRRTLEAEKQNEKAIEEKFKPRYSTAFSNPPK